jgi:uncharacterized spore protein YtfJ
MTELKATEPIEQLFEKLKVDAVFGKPVQEGETTIIPVADVAVGFGFGSGISPAAEDDDGEDADSDKSEGGGAGGKATARGYIKITPEGVDFVSTLDEGRVAMAGIALSAWAVFWVAMTIRAFIKR